MPSLRVLFLVQFGLEWGSCDDYRGLVSVLCNIIEEQIQIPETLENSVAELANSHQTRRKTKTNCFSFATTQYKYNI